MLKVLQIAYGFEGGVGKVVTEYYAHMNREKYAFDIVVWESEDGNLTKKAKELGNKIYKIKRDNSWKDNYDYIISIIQNENYDIIHFHGIFDWHLLKYAKKAGIKTRIVHSHCSFNKDFTVGGKKNETLKERLQNFLVRHYATELWGCGREANLFQWGIHRGEKCYVMKNAVDVHKLKFDEQERDLVRSRLNLSNKFVIGNVARFTYQKNHEFLIRIFFEIAKINDRAMLMLIGSGEMEEAARRQVEELNLTDKVLFLGNRADVPSLLNAMDVFVLTSRWEGLPVVEIEAQANGLNCVVSSNITKECSILPGNVYESLESTPIVWADAILASGRDHDIKADELMRKMGYDISFAAKEVEAKYRGIGGTQ